MKLTYKQIVELLESRGYVVFGCDGQQSSGTWLMTAGGPNGASVRRVYVDADGSHIWS